MDNSHAKNRKRKLEKMEIHLMAGSRFKLHIFKVLILRSHVRNGKTAERGVPNMQFSHRGRTRELNLTGDNDKTYNARLILGKPG
jgi:hypothetical protein